MASEMKNRALIGAAALLLAACAAPQRPQLDVNPFGVQVRAEHTGSGITLEREQELVVRLTSSVHENREWTLVDFAPGVLTGTTAPVFERESLSSNFNDASGAAVWHFKPAAAGTVVLKFDYRHPRTLDPASRTVSYTVTVR